jgi:hypothetical protein
VSNRNTHKRTGHGDEDHDTHLGVEQLAEEEKKIPKIPNSEGEVRRTGGVGRPSEYFERDASCEQRNAPRRRVRENGKNDALYDATFSIITHIMKTFITYV